jgi:ribosomal protein L4
MLLIFSELVRTDRLKVVVAFDVKDANTKNITALLKALDVKDALLMTDELDENLYLSSRNLYTSTSTTCTFLRPRFLTATANSAAIFLRFRALTTSSHIGCCHLVNQ